LTWILFPKIPLYLSHGVVVEDEASLENRGGYVDLDGLAQNLALELSAFYAHDIEAVDYLLASGQSCSVK
jgi:hypothetical protein